MDKINHTQIAEAAGVSRATVSRALQNHPSLPESTRTRIQTLADQMGYRPNPLLSALMSARNRPHLSDVTTLAVLTSWPPPSELAPYPTIRRILAGALVRARDLGYRLEEFWLDEPGMTHGRLARILMNRGIVAVLIAPIPPNHPAIEFNWDRFSVASFAHYSVIPDLHCAAHFHFNSYLNAINELIRLGYRRPGLILAADTPAHVLKQWYGAHHAAVASLSPPDRLEPGIFPNIIAKEVAGWCRKQRPDVLLSNDRDIPRYLGAAGLATAFASLDRYPEDELFAGVDQAHEQIGSTAIDLIVAQVNRNERGIPPYSKTVLIEGRWVHGASAPARVPSA